MSGARRPRALAEAFAELTRRGRREREQRPPEPTLAAIAQLARDGPAPLASPLADAAGPLRIAAVVPSFRQGSGGHATIVNLLGALRARGHDVSVWLEDCEGRHAHESAQMTAQSFARFFSAGELSFHTSTGTFDGADIALATGWQTVPRALLLPHVAARAYLVQDHEPDFYPASAESLWAAATYRRHIHCIAASPWLAKLLRKRYGASASHFYLAVDRDLYRPARDHARREDSVVFYARAVTPRRAVPLGLLALDELARRRPHLEIALFGESAPLAARFPHRQLGVLTHTQLVTLYSQASVGMVLSLTNPSLIGLEMMACGLPCVELASESMLATFDRDGPLTLAEPDPVALCSAIESLLDDPMRRERVAAAGASLAAERTWERAAAQVEDGLRVALAGGR